MKTTPNLYGFATKELAQDATIAYLLAWADPAYRRENLRLHALGTELLRSLLQTQQVDLPRVETLWIETQVHRIDIVVRINADKKTDRIILLIEDKVSTREHSNQIEYYKEVAKEKYGGEYDRLVAVYLKTGNESRSHLPPEDRCGRFMRRDLLDVLNEFQDTENVIVDDFRTHLQGWEDDTNKWEKTSSSEWEWKQWEGFYAALERKLYCVWGYIPIGDFLGCWLSFKHIGTEDRYADLYLQIHNGTRLTVRLGTGNVWDKVRKEAMYQVFDALNEYASDDIRIEKAGRFRGGNSAAVANVTFGDEEPWFAVDGDGVVDLKATIGRIRRLGELLQKVADCLTERGIIN